LSWWIGYGTGTANVSKDVTDNVLTAFEAGFTHIDTAEYYQNEDSVGNAIHQYLIGPSNPGRESIFITTKICDLEPGQTVRDRLLASLKKLQVDYVDLYLIHYPPPFIGRIKEVWKQFEEVQKEGLAKNIGVSNFRIRDFDEFISSAEIIPVCNQIEYNPYLLKASESLLGFHKKYNILTVSYAGLNPIHKHRGGPLDSLLPTIRERLSKDAGKEVTEEQVLTKWTLAKGVLPITTSSKKDRLVTMLETRSLPDLTQAEVDQIDELGKTVHRRRYQLHMDEL